MEWDLGAGVGRGRSVGAPRRNRSLPIRVYQSCSLVVRSIRWPAKS